MERLMVVTVGTSLFQSASWDQIDKIFPESAKTYRNYYQKYWISDENNGGLDSPDYRRKNDFGLEEYFQNELKSENAETWSNWIASYQTIITPKMRYSAELATLLNYADILAKWENCSWVEALNKYDIYFIHDFEPESHSCIAAKHNCVYARKILVENGFKFKPKQVIMTYPLKKFSGNEPLSLTHGLKAFQQWLLDAQFNMPPFEQIDVVISGGYKAYSLVGHGFLLDPRFRVVYQHEKFNHVVVQDRDKLSIGKNAPVAFHAIIEKGGR